MALAFDAAVDGGSTTGTSRTFSHTCSGSNRLLIVGVRGGTTADGDVITGVTYNGVSMTKIFGNEPLGNRWTYLYYLINPASGANNVVISASASINISGAASSYTGAYQSSQPDAYTNNSSATSPLTTTNTTLIDNCWNVLVVVSNTGQAASTGSTQRTIDGAGTFGLYDTNGAKTPAGSVSMTVTALNFLNSIMASIIPDTYTPTSTFIPRINIY